MGSTTRPPPEQVLLAVGWSIPLRHFVWDGAERPRNGVEMGQGDPGWCSALVGVEDDDRQRGGQKVGCDQRCVVWCITGAAWERPLRPSYNLMRLSNRPAAGMDGRTSAGSRRVRPVDRFRFSSEAEAELR